MSQELWIVHLVADRGENTSVFGCFSDACRSALPKPDLWLVIRIASSLPPRPQEPCPDARLVATPVHRVDVRGADDVGQDVPDLLNMKIVRLAALDTLAHEPVDVMNRVKVALSLKASAKATAPGTPILFALKWTLVEVALSLKASAKATAPESPIVINLKWTLVKVALSLKASA